LSHDFFQELNDKKHTTVFIVLNFRTFYFKMLTAGFSHYRLIGYKVCT